MQHSTEPTTAPAGPETVPTTADAQSSPRTGRTAPALGWGPETELDADFVAADRDQHRRARWTCLALTVLVGLFVSFFALNDYRVPTKHEAYAMVPAREMAATGDWIVPTFAGRPRLEKPPLAYWTLGTMTLLLGDLEPWQARLPSAFSSLALAVLTGLWAGRRFGWAGGIAAGACVATSGYLVSFGRKAEIDVLLCLTTTTSLFLLAHEPDDEPARRRLLRWTAVYALLGLSWLAKWHYGTAMVLGPYVVFQLVQRRPRRLLRLLQPVGLVLFAACVVVWPYLVLRQLPAATDVWWHETVARALPGVFRDDPWYYYLPHVVSLTMPWTPLVLWGLPASWRRAWRDADEHDRFLWVTIGVQTAILLMSSNKHRHYLLAMLPLLSLFAADVASRLVHRMQHGRAPFSRRLAVVGSLLVLTGTVFGWRRAVADWPEWSHLFAGLACLGVGATLATTWLLRARRGLAAAVVATAGFLVVHGVVHAVVMPRIDENGPTAAFAERVRETIGPDDEPRLLGIGTEPVVEYLGSPARRTDLFPPEPLGHATRFVVTHHERVDGVFAAVPGRVLLAEPGDDRKRLVLLELDRPVGGSDRVAVQPAGTPAVVAATLANRDASSDVSPSQR